MASDTKSLVRVLGAVLGALGIFVLLCTLIITVTFVGISKSRDNDVLHNIGVVMILVIAFTTAFYFLYVGYLAWFKLSQTTINYVCGTYCFFIWAAANGYLIHAKGSTPSANIADGLLCLFAMVVAYYAYRAAVRYLTRKIFPAPNALV
jgi:drug/metabolite transporter (DMT)-like permease